MVERFDVFLVNLDPHITRDPKNTRPSVVISPNEMNRYLSTVLIAPLSSPSTGWPTRISTVFLNGERSVVLDQIRSTDAARLVKKIGSLDAATRVEILRTLTEMFAE